jgi:hypothetical protein
MVPEVASRFWIVPVEAWRKVAKRFVVVTLVLVTFANQAFQRSAELPKDSCASKVGMRLVETKPETPRFVVVTFVPVAFVKARPWRLVLPRTVKVEVTVEDDPRNPPYKKRVWVVVAPRAVTVCKVSVVAVAGQLVPFSRQTSNPPTWRTVKVPVAPVSVPVTERLVRPRVCPVAFVKVRV